MAKMQIFIDESGNFDARNPNMVSVLGSVVFPENVECYLEKFFSKLTKHVSKEEKNANGEMKGCLMSDKNLSRVFEFLARHREFRISLKIFDSEFNCHADLKKHRQQQAATLQESLDRYMQGPVKSITVQNELQTFINTAGRSDKVSDQDFAQMMLMTDLIHTSIQKSLIYFANKKYAPAFQKFYFRCDGKSSWKYKDYLNTLITSFLETERSGNQENGMITIKEMSFHGHPIERFTMDLSNGRKGFDIVKIFENGIQFEDSKKFLGLRLIDIIVSGMQGIILNKRDLSLFDMIRVNCAYFKRQWQTMDICKLDASANPKPSRAEIYSFLQRQPKKCWSAVLRPD
jgi:hypothetical protein